MTRAPHPQRYIKINKMKKNKIRNIIIISILCPVIVGIILKYLPSSDKSYIAKTEGDYSNTVVGENNIIGDQVTGNKIEEKTTVNVNGDIVYGDKYETNQNIVQKSPSDFIKFSN